MRFLILIATIFFGALSIRAQGYVIKLEKESMYEVNIPDSLKGKELPICVVALAEPEGAGCCLALPLWGRKITISEKKLIDLYKESHGPRPGDPAPARVVISMEASQEESGQWDVITEVYYPKEEQAP